MQVQVNGRPQTLPGPTSVAALLASLGLKSEGVAIAINLNVVPRSAHAVTLLQEGDRVEILQAVGGG